MGIDIMKYKFVVSRFFENSCCLVFYFVFVKVCLIIKFLVCPLNFSLENVFCLIRMLASVSDVFRVDGDILSR